MLTLDIGALYRNKAYMSSELLVMSADFAVNYKGIYDFLAYYVSFQNQENFAIFEQEVETKLGRSNIMGTRVSLKY